MDFSFQGLNPEQKTKLQNMLNGTRPEPGQVMGGAWDALNIGVSGPANGMQLGAINAAGRAPQWMGGPVVDAATEAYTPGYMQRFAGGNLMRRGLKLGTGLAAAGGVLGAGDVLLGNDSFANKAMDTAAMGIGGFLGMAGGPVGAAAGAGLGKTASDSLQWLFGDKMTAEQRQMQEALTGLTGGRI